jgi:putative transposase
LEALKGLKTVNELAAGYGVHPTQITQWKCQLGAEAKEIFGSRRLKEAQDQEVVQASLYEEIGRLKMELDWIKKLQASAEEKQLWIDPGHPELSIRR